MQLRVFFTYTEERARELGTLEIKARRGAIRGDVNAMRLPLPKASVIDFDLGARTASFVWSKWIGSTFLPSTCKAVLDASRETMCKCFLCKISFMVEGAEDASILTHGISGVRNLEDASDDVDMSAPSGDPLQNAYDPASGPKMAPLLQAAPWRDTSLLAVEEAATAEPAQTAPEQLAALHQTVAGLRANLNEALNEIARWKKEYARAEALRADADQNAGLRGLLTDLRAENDALQVELLAIRATSRSTARGLHELGLAPPDADGGNPQAVMQLMHQRIRDFAAGLPPRPATPVDCAPVEAATDAILEAERFRRAEAEKFAFVEQVRRAEAEDVVVRQRARLEEARESAASERARRMEVEALLREVRDERAEPFIMPALFDAFVRLSKMTTDAIARDP